MELGRHKIATVFAHRAVQIRPAEAGLHANLALARLIAGHIPEAQSAIERALAAAPDDNISKAIQSVIQHFAANGHTPPMTAPALQNYWAKNGNSV
jgi:hypothetical protein